MRVLPNDYVRFYGNVVTKNGVLKKFAFRVRLNLARHAGRFYYQKIVATINLMFQKTAIPLNSNGDLYPTFKSLFASPWMKVRRIRHYEVGTKYER